MAFTQSDLDKLNSAIAAGTLEVEYNGIRTKYHSITELIKARDLVAKEVAGGASAFTNPSISYAQHSRG